MRRPRRSYLSIAIFIYTVVAILPLVPEERSLYVTAATGETAIIPIREIEANHASIALWAMQENGITGRARISAVRRTTFTERIQSLHLWHVIEPMEWSILNSFPNLKSLTITGMRFERDRLFDHGAPKVEILVISETYGCDRRPVISLKRFPALVELGYMCSGAEDIPLLVDIPPSLETVTFHMNRTIVFERATPRLIALSGLKTINVWPLQASDEVRLQFPQLADGAGPWDGSRRRDR